MKAKLRDVGTYLFLLLCAFVVVGSLATCSVLIVDRVFEPEIEPCIQVGGYTPDGVLVYEDQVPTVLAVTQEGNRYLVYLRSFDQGHVYYSTSGCSGTTIGN